MKNLFPLFALLLLCFGCQRHYYIPNTMYVPDLKEKNEVHAQSSLSFLSGHTSFELQTAYSPFKRTALTLNYMYSTWGRGSTYADSSAAPGRGNFVELGLGRSIPLGSKQFSFSLYGGYGLGFMRNLFFTDRIDPSGVLIGKRVFNTALRYQRVFLQPALTVRQGMFHGTILYRFCHVHHYYGRVDFQTPDEKELNAIKKIEAISPIFLREYGLQVGFTKSPINVSWNFTFSNPPEGVHFAKSNISMTMGINLSELVRNSK